MSDDQRQRLTRSLVGQDAVCEALLTAASANRLSASLILNGRAGSGRKSLAFLIAVQHLVHGTLRHAPNALPDECGFAFGLMEQGAHPDFLVIRPEGAKGEIRAEAARQLQDFHSKTPAMGPGKVALIENADALNRTSANALLKVIEEPKPSLRVLLVTKSVAGLLPTIRSRCSVYTLVGLEAQLIEQLLAARGLSLPPAAIHACEGDASLALTLAEQEIALDWLDPLKVTGTPPRAGFTPAQVAGLVKAEKDLGGQIVARLALAAMASSVKAINRTPNLSQAQGFVEIEKRLHQRAQLSLDSTATWTEVLAQFHDMLTSE